MKKLLIILVLVLLGLSACTHQESMGQPQGDLVEKSNSRDVPSIIFTSRPIEVEYGSKDVQPLSWIVTGNWEEISVSKVDTFKLGPQEIIYTLKGLKEDKDVPFHLTVVDSQSPVFEDTIVELSLEHNQELNSSLFKASDPVDGEVAVRVQPGTFDHQQLGQQTVMLEAIDVNGNKSTKEVMVNVVSSEEFAGLNQNELIKTETKEVSANQKGSVVNSQKPSQPTSQPHKKPETPVVSQPVEKPVPIQQPKPKPQPEPEPKPDPIPEPTPTPQPQPVITTENITTTENIPFETQRVNDASLNQGQEVISVTGVSGVRTITTQVTYRDGVETGRSVISNSITTQPVHQVVLVGTKAVLEGSGIWVSGKEFVKGTAPNGTTDVPHSIYENTKAGFDQANAMGESLIFTEFPQGTLYQYFVASYPFTDGTVHYVLILLFW